MTNTSVSHKLKMFALGTIFLLFIFGNFYGVSYFPRASEVPSHIVMNDEMMKHKFRRQEISTKLLSFYTEQYIRLNKTWLVPSLENGRLSFTINKIATLHHITAERKRRSILHTSQSLFESQVLIILKCPGCDNPISLFVLNLNIGPINQSNFSISVVRPIGLKTNLTIQSHETEALLRVGISTVFRRNITLLFSYRFYKSIDETQIEWPTWPLTPDCVKSYNFTLVESSNQNNLPICTMTTLLNGSTTAKKFEIERQAVAYWLDLEYENPLHPKNKSQVDNINCESDRRKNTEKRRRVPFEKYEDGDICTKPFQKWVEDYQLWHSEISLEIGKTDLTHEQQRDRIVDLNIRFVVYEPSDSGLADRTLHLISTYLVAVLTKRFFVFDDVWPEFQEIMISRLDFHSLAVTPWVRNLEKLNANFNMTNPRFLTSKFHWFSLERYRTDYDYDKLFPERILRLKGHTGNVIHTVTSLGSPYRKFLRTDLKMTETNMFGCLYHSLIIPRLSALFRSTLTVPEYKPLGDRLGQSPQLILRSLLSPNFKTIGIHVRSGDHSMTENPKINNSYYQDDDYKLLEQFDGFFECARDISENNQRGSFESSRQTLVFLTSDTAPLRQAALRRWQLSVNCIESLFRGCHRCRSQLLLMAHPDPVSHIGYTVSHLFALTKSTWDIFLISLCDDHIISTHSGFGKFAAFTSLNMRNIYSFVPGEKHSCLDERQSIRLFDAGHTWSGVR